ncbi:MAG: protein kinase [Bryobacterales bacterium]|nr:protein kinase [Bryobacterales bacterium]
MDAARWQRISDAFSAACDAAPADRERILEQQCAADATLRAEVESLLRRHDQTGNAIDQLRSAIGGLHRDDKPPVRLTPGTRLAGRFQVTRLLGAGGMGEVYEAFDEELDTTVALKLIGDIFSSEPQAQGRFKREVQMARRVSHPNVCRVYDVFRHQDPDSAASFTFLTMERIEGETLAARLARTGALALGEGADIARQIAAGLAAAHASGIVHRDLKPGNVMLAPTPQGPPRAVILDFGLAKAPPGQEGHDTLSASHHAIGTPSYMAPEQIENGTVSPRTDIYAFGVVLFEMVTGRVPFTDKSPLAQAARKVKDAPPSPRQFRASLPPSWEAAILRCLRTNPEERFASATEVMEAIAQRRRFHVPHLNIRTRWVAAALLAVVIAGAMWWAYQHRGLPKPAVEAQRWYRQGLEAFHDGSYLAAGRQFQTAIDKDNRFVLAQARRAQTLVENDDLDGARDAMLQVNAAVPNRDNLPVAQRLALAAAQHAVSRDFGEAASQYMALADVTNGEERLGALLDAGHYFRKAGRPADALQATERVLALRNDHPAAHLRAGMLHAQDRRIEAAWRSFDAAYGFYETLGRFEGLTEVELQRGEALRNASRFADADAAYQRAARRAESNDDASRQVRVLFGLSALRQAQGDMEAAGTLSAQGVAIAREKRLEWLSASGLNDLAFSWITQFKWKEAEPLLREALDLARAARNRQAEARGKLLMSTVAYYSARADEAERLATEILPFYDNAGMRSNLGQVRALLARIAVGKGQYDSAARQWGEVRQLALDLRDDKLQTLAEEGLATVSSLRGDYPRARNHYGASASIHRRIGRKSDLAYALMNQADQLWQMGRYGDAADRLNEASSAAAGDQRVRGRIEITRAEMAASRGDRVAVVRHVKEARRLAPEQSVTGEARLLALEAFAERSGAKCGRAVAQARKSRSGVWAPLALLCGEKGVIPQILTDPLTRTNPDLTLRANAWLGDQNAVLAKKSELEKQWDKEVLRDYLARPDVSALLSSLGRR